jgi:hypothetical protein
MHFPHRPETGQFFEACIYRIILQKNATRTAPNTANKDPYEIL